MSDELDFELDQLEEDEKVKRIRTLSDKVKLTSQERDELATAKENEAKARAEAERDRDFYKGFNQVSTKYQGASEYQDQILEKVRGGYDVEDATVAILNREGKLTTQQATIERESAAGGSATNQLKADEKTLDTAEARAAAVQEAASRGDIRFD